MRDERPVLTRRVLGCRSQRAQNTPGLLGSCRPHALSCSWRAVLARHGLVTAQRTTESKLQVAVRSLGPRRARGSVWRASETWDGCMHAQLLATKQGQTSERASFSSQEALQRPGSQCDYKACHSFTAANTHLDGRPTTTACAWPSHQGPDQTLEAHPRTTTPVQRAPPQNP